MLVCLSSRLRVQELFPAADAAVITISGNRSSHSRCGLDAQQLHTMNAHPNAHPPASKPLHTGAPGGAPSGALGTSSSAAAAAGGQAAHAHPHTTKYICALYGLIRYESTGAVLAGAPSAPTVAVAKLCSLLRAMCHSDGQRLLHGRQAVALLDMPAAPPAANTRLAAPLPFVPPTPQSPYIGHSLTPSALARGSTAASTTAAPAVSFSAIPTFNQASLALTDALSSTVGLHGLPPANAQLAADLEYLREREKRLGPITQLIAAHGASHWSLLLPQRYSRYVRCYRSIAVLPPGSPAIEGEMQAWREVEVPSGSGLPVHFAQNSAQSASTSPNPSSSSGASHECWRISYLGKALLPTKSLVHVRPIRVTPISTNYTAFLEQNPAVAYEREYEYVQEGFRFEDRDGIEILIYQVLKVSEKSRRWST